MKTSTLIAAAFAVALPLALSFNLMGNNTGAPAGHSGAPGDMNCTMCHTGATLNSGPATLLLTFSKNGTASSTYTPGATYQVATVLSRQGAAKFGYQLKASAGTLAVQSGDMRSQINGAGEATHTLTGTNPLTPTPTSTIWPIDWTAPTGSTAPASVTFYVGAIVGNGNNQNSGDTCYTGMKTVNKALGTSAPETYQLLVYPTPATDYVNVRAPHQWIGQTASAMATYVLYDAAGSRVRGGTLHMDGNAPATIATTGLSSGLYHLLAKDAKGSTARATVIVQ